MKVVLSLGSNYGDRAASVANAIEWLSGVLSHSATSGIYETPPVGHEGSNYMNAVMSGIWDGSLQDLDRLCKEYEISHGRDEASRIRNHVPVDIDIVMADNEVLRPKDYRCTFFKIGFNQIK